ncbi:MAG: hypothetical protein RIC55_30940 [Pirellulaceae bacterium]
MQRRLVFLIVISLLLGSIPAAVLAGSGNDAPLPAFTPDGEAAVLKFVDEHHPELGALMRQLKSADVEQYRQAVRETLDNVEKLSVVKQNDKVLHALMLEAWIVKSKAELLAAQLVLGQQPDKETEQQIKELLYRRVDLERRQMEHRRDRLAELLKAAEENIERAAQNRDRMVDVRFNILTRGARKPE